jgi:hypothetical protein
MVQTPVNLGQRILQAARIAQAIHQELDQPSATRESKKTLTPTLSRSTGRGSKDAGGAGRISFDQHDHDDNSN